MAFLDNSGDIILDAVLTDTGRKRLAQGDGSFKIVKFAFGDDEIDYTTYDGQHSSGSAYYDLEILQTPVFEAFTNNTSLMKSKLISLTNNNLLYLPVLKLNDKSVFTPAETGTDFLNSGSHVLVVDGSTSVKLNLITGAGVGEPGFINGFGTVSANSNQIRVDQGLDTTEVAATLTIDPELKETQYIIEMDSRFASLRDTVTEGAPIANPSFIDDDLVATYYVTQNIGSYVANSVAGELGSQESDADDNNETIQGPRGTNLRFGLRAATDVVSSDYLFNTLGTDIVNGSDTYSFIDTSIRVTGVTTGYRLDIPLRIVKLQD
tara:strand:- start:87 stop:1049 length:963 start_codon:yes stop_codon:yes gene_type:complete